MSYQTLQQDEELLRAPLELERRATRRLSLDRWLAVRYIARPQFQPQQAIVLNVSRHGIGLIVHQAVQPGTVVAIQLRSRHTEFMSILTAQVRHATWRAANCWLIGCRLRKPLDEELVRLLLGDEASELDSP